MSAKLFLGHRLRRLRRDCALSQTDMAQSLGISPSYLNHLERNQRPVTATLLLKLAELYDVDVRAFAAGGGAHTGPDALVEIFSHALLSDLAVPRHELVELANNSPTVADAIARLYTAVKEAERHPILTNGADARALVTPENWVRDYIQQHRNHYPELEQAAETLGATPFKVFFTVTLPLALPGVLAGMVLGFAKAIGEFGATITFVSNIPGETQTISSAIYSLIQTPDGDAAAMRLVLISIAIAFAALIGAEWFARRATQRLHGN